jgi:hypothetical protein
MQGGSSSVVMHFYLYFFTAIRRGNEVEIFLLLYRAVLIVVISKYRYFLPQFFSGNIEYRYFLLQFFFKFLNTAIFYRADFVRFADPCREVTTL